MHPGSRKNPLTNPKRVIDQNLRLHLLRKMRRCFIGVNLFDSLEIGCQVSGVRRDAMATKDFLDVEDLAFFSLTPEH